MAFFWSKNRWKANNVTKIFSQWLWLPANQSNVGNKKQKQKNELFWLIILSTTLSDFGDNFGIERWNEKKNYTHYNTKIFWMEKNNTYEHYALKTMMVFSCTTTTTRTLCCQVKKKKCNVPFQFLWKVVNSKL